METARDILTSHGPCSVTFTKAVSNNLKYSTEDCTQINAKNILFSNLAASDKRMRRKEQEQTGMEKVSHLFHFA